MPTEVGIHVFLAVISKFLAVISKVVDGGPSPAMTMAWRPV
jgi:hypothetical protein